MDGSYEGRASDEDHCGAENRKLYSGMFFINHTTFCSEILVLKKSLITFLCESKSIER